MGRLGSLGGVDPYSFTGKAGKGYEVVLRAKRKGFLLRSIRGSRCSTSRRNARSSRTTIAPPRATPNLAKTSLSGAHYVSAHYVIVDNEGTDATDLSYDLEFSLHP